MNPNDYIQILANHVKATTSYNAKDTLYPRIKKASDYPYTRMARIINQLEQYVKQLRSSRTIKAGLPDKCNYYFREGVKILRPHNSWDGRQKKVQKASNGKANSPVPFALPFKDAGRSHR